jgi:hypothetical protein
VGSQFWDLDFTQGASHDPGPGIFLAHDFQDMDGERGDFTVSEGHGHPLVVIIITFQVCVDFYGDGIGECGG